jgi:hypothetical protein
MSSGSGEEPRPPDEAAEDQSTNELGFRDVDEEGDYDESRGSQGGASRGGAQGDSPPDEREGDA